MNVGIIKSLILFALLMPGILRAVTVEDFKVNNTLNLLNLCTVDEADPVYPKAIHFCHGYLVGAYHYFEAVNNGPDVPPLVCLPQDPPSRNESIDLFIAWVQKHPEYHQESAVETEFRFLIHQWPCKNEMETEGNS